MDSGIDPGLVLKITPPKLRKSLLLRERLRSIPSDDSDAAVLLVEAPAGHGKTSLLAQWRLDWMQAGAAVAWLSLDSGDSAVSIVSGMVEGLRRATGHRAFGLEAIEGVRRGADPNQALTSLLAEITEAAVPMVLVFDNFERVRAEAVLEVFDYLLHNLPPNLQVAFGSRPPAPLRAVDLLGSGVLRRITPEELRFDLAETIRLLTARLGDRVDADVCARLHEVTEGWALGLQIAASALERAVDPMATVAAFAASREDTTRQMFDSMLNALPASLSEFVMKCGLLDALHPALCESVAGEEKAALYLQQLLVETPLLSATEDGEWIRFHPLAREYLRSRAESQIPEAARREMHAHAWQWFASRGVPEQAAQHALAAGRRQEAFALIAGSLNEQYEQGNLGTVVEWLTRIPAEEIQRNIQLRAVAMWVQVLSYRSLEALPATTSLANDPNAAQSVRDEAVLASGVLFSFMDELDTAWNNSSRFSATAVDSRGRRALANIETFFAMYAGTTEIARQHQVRNPDDGRLPAARIWGDFLTGLTYLWEGRPVSAYQATQRHLVHAEARLGRRGHWPSMLGSVLAGASWQMDRREEARALLADRLDVIEQSTMPEGIAYTYRTLARMAMCEGDEPRAFTYLEALAAMGARRGLPRFTVVSLTERVRLHAVGHRPAQAASLRAELAAVFRSYAPCSRLEPLMRLESCLAAAYSAWVADDLAAAGDALAAAWSHASAVNRGYELVQILALQALLAERAGDSPFAFLIDALSRAESGGLVRVFADTLPEVVELVRSFGERAANSPVSHTFIERVLAAANVAEAETRELVRASGSAILTPKEAEVLRLLAGGLPNKRIGTELGLSGDTVKWHLKKLFAKLGAGSREHAVARARMLGLLR